MSGHYQSYKHLANSKIPARLKEAERHRLTKQSAQESGFSIFKSIFNSIMKFIGGLPRVESDQEKETLRKDNPRDLPHRQRYAD